MFGTEHGTYLLTRHVTEFMHGRSAAFRSRFGSANSDLQSVRTYPNGAIQIEGVAAEFELLTILRQEGVLGKELIAWTQFRSLPPFPKGLFQLIYTGEYFERAGQRGFVVVPTAYGPTSGGDDDLVDLCVSVGFRRRQSKESMRLFARVLRSWSESARARGECSRTGQPFSLFQMSSFKVCAPSFASTCPGRAKVRSIGWFW
jgi:hypothetical protein